MDQCIFLKSRAGRRSLATLLTVTTLLSACGASSSDTSAAPSSDASTEAAGLDQVIPLCSAWLEIEAKSAALSDPDTADNDVMSTADELASTLLSSGEPPEDVADATASLRAAFDTVASGDRTALDDPSVSDAYDSISAWTHQSCGFATIDLTAVDYAYQGVPASVPSGATSISLTNEGADIHMVLLFRLNDGVTAKPEEILAGDIGDYGSEVAGGAFTAPTSTRYLAANLEPGTYLIACPLPVGMNGDGPPTDGPPHFMQGMWARFTVTP